MSGDKGSSLLHTRNMVLGEKLDLSWLMFLQTRNEGFEIDGL